MSVLAHRSLWNMHLGDQFGNLGKCFLVAKSHPQTPACQHPRNLHTIPAAFSEQEARSTRASVNWVRIAALHGYPYRTAVLLLLVLRVALSPWRCLAKVERRAAPLYAFGFGFRPVRSTC